MDDVMDLYDRLPPTDMLSLEEMIERDMRSEHFESDGSCSHFEFGDDYNDTLATTASSGDRFENGGISSVGDILDSDYLCLNGDDRNDLPWFNMNNGNLDFDPRTVLVNPNTGLRAADESNRSESGEDESLSKPVKPSLVECDDSINSIKPVMERRQFQNNRNRLFVRNGGNYFKIDKDADSSESDTSDDDDDKEVGLKYENSLSKMTKVFSPTNRMMMVSNGPMGHLPLSLASCDHAQLEQGPFTGRIYPKPAYSYSCLIAIALKNSVTGNLPVSEIYSFMIKTFPYFKTAPNGWKNSVRHNLSLNKCFEKIENVNHGSNQRKGCLWGLNPDKAIKMDEEVQKWNRKDPIAIRKSMARPETLELLEKGALKVDHSNDQIKSMVSKVKVEIGEEPMAADDIDFNQESEDDSDSDESLDMSDRVEVI